MINVTVTVISTPEDERLLVPADQVTDLLRRLAAEWTSWPQDAELGLDPRTIGAMACVMTDLADQVDAECIGLSS